MLPRAYMIDYPARYLTIGGSGGGGGGPTPGSVSLSQGVFYRGSGGTISGSAGRSLGQQAISSVSTSQGSVIG